MEGSVLSFLKAEWKVSDTGSAQCWASSFTCYFIFTLFPTGIHSIRCFTINVSGETYIEPGVPYKVTCTVSEFRANRKTIYSATISEDDATDIVIVDLETGTCVYRAPAAYPPCQSSLCSCDMDGLATHWTYNTPTDLSSPVTFICTSQNNEGYLNRSDAWIPTVPSKCFVLRLITFCVSEGKQICLRNYVYLCLTYMQFVIYTGMCLFQICIFIKHILLSNR
jgi:hypothetical protein